MGKIKNLLLIAVFIGTSLGAFAQTEIRGTVTSKSNGETIPGANVVVKGTTQGTITGMDGRFTITVNDKNATLECSFIGFKKVELPLNGRTEVNIVIEPDVISLQEVVAVGYSTVSKRDLTGSVGQVKGEVLAKSPVTNYDQALAGRVAGVQVSAADGTPGEGLNIVIRGGNSITGDNSPLYVVDGIPIEDFDPGSISSHDIESFDVLKDASASAIYGSRGANGVIIITTKSGRNDGTTEISLNSSIGSQWIDNRLDVMSPYDYVKYLQEVQTFRGDTYLESFNTYWVDPEEYKNAQPINWQDNIMRTAFIQNHNLSLSGGTNKSSIYLSVDYSDQAGTLINTGYKKINNNLKFTHRINEKAQLGGYLNYSYIYRNGLNVSGNNRLSIIRDAITFRPVRPLVDDGKEGGLDLEDPNDLRFDPVKTLSNTDRYQRQDVVRGSLFLNYNITTALKLKVSGNYQVNNQKESVFYKKDTYQGTKGIDGVNGTLSDRHNQTLSTSNTLTYKKKFNKIHNLTALVGTEAQISSVDNFQAKNKKIPTDAFGTDKLELGTEPEIPTSYASENKLVSFFGSVNYGYKDRYLLTMNYRADGSSKFAKGNRWGYFPSAALAWRLIEEQFISNLNIFSNLKLRVGYGVTGNNRINDSAAFSLINYDEYSGYSFGNAYALGTYYASLASADLKWETTAQSNLGIDLGFADNRVVVTADFYRKNTSDLLLNADMALSTGYSQVLQNVGEVRNEGLELSLNTVNVSNKSFRWNTSFNISFNKNKTISLNSGQDAIYTNPDWYFKFTEYQYITKVGEPVGMIYGLKRDGVYQFEDFNYDEETDTYTLKEGIPDNGKTVAPGSVKFKDISGLDGTPDGTINELDRVVIGNPHPKHFGGITNNFWFKNFDLEVFFQWSYGNDILNANRVMFENPGLIGPEYNMLAAAADRWTPENPTNEVQAYQYAGVYGFPQDGNLISDYYVEDGSYLKLKTVTFGYTFNKSILNKLGIKSCRLYVAGQNLYTWTKYSGYDPDVSVGKYGALTPGLDYSAYPMSSTFMGGVEIKF
ncbi:TonB-linked outer membrane protein, SusC/RagA family [Mariniphaga anaerophila]|uniref:TonB-linked outer membrane protein, SusC/RagA family n=1 Tax=Mariniphaga anaerophila TaxID=1484053 RepID=A0A1M4SFF7_9BACT|nr:TonB-dependent receptor [Mariniphaga anaerophila]SHE30727.1 TonB-linked outer membrane protein, SusC/RagA family [Mariniphaga anaerophila]